MREILFRGKRVDNGEWIYGNLVQDRDLNIYYIEFFDYYTDGYSIHREYFQHEVMPITVGQFTGLTDKNGKKIFEGDICSADLFIPYKTVIFRNGCFMYQLNDGDSDYYDIMMPIEPLINADVYTEVIGNIHDNSDLIEECK